MVDDWSKLMIPPLHEAPLEDCCGGTVKTAPFGRVKDTLSAGASSTIIRPMGEEFYSWYIRWSTIGGIRYTLSYLLYSGSKECRGTLFLAYYIQATKSVGVHSFLPIVIN